MEPIKQIKSVAQTYSEMIEGYKKGLNMDDAGARRLQRKTGIDLGADPGPEGVPLGDPKATAAVEANRLRLQKKATIPINKPR